MSKSYNFASIAGVKEALESYRFIRPHEINYFIQGPPHIIQGGYIPFNLNLDTENAVPLYINNDLTTLPDSSNTNSEGVLSVSISPKDTEPYKEIVKDFVIKKGICSNLAETINAKLCHLMEYNLGFTKREQLFNWPFSTLVSNYVGRIKKFPQFRNAELFPDNQSIEKFRRLFSEFVEDRNLYTHGQVTVLRNSQNVCIKINDRIAKKVRYFDIQEAHFSHFSLAFLIIDSCLKINSKESDKSTKKQS